MTAPIVGDHTQHSYKLRSQGLQAIGPGIFFIQSFGTDHSVIQIHTATTTISESKDFAGADPLGPLVSANFQRLPYFKNGEEVFSGQTVEKPIHSDNDTPQHDKEDDFLNQF